MNSIIFKGNRKDKYDRIFVDLPHGLGDQVMCLPLFKSLKNKFPKAKISVFTPNSASAALLELFPWVDDYKTIDITFSYLGIMKFFLKHYFSLRSYVVRSKFDLYIAPHYNPLRRLFSSVFPFPAALLNKEHVHKVKGVENALECLGIDVDYDYSLKPSPVTRIKKKFALKNSEYVVLDLYAQHLERDPRQWFCFDELISALRKEGCTVVLVGLNASHVHKEGVVDLVNLTSFHELLDVLQGAKFVVALDSGVFHLAYCLDKPVLGLFGPVDPQERKPRGKEHVHCLYSDVECSPCIVNKVDIPCANHAFPYKCMKSITVEDVMAAIKEI